ncbi:hypothetical protein PFISCL1PPCAC_25795, partial [Pristionchus fissidentatus]
NQSAMRKEISAATSKGDRNDSKLFALTERTQHFDNRMSDLKSSQKSMGDSFKRFEEASDLRITHLESIEKNLGMIRTEMKEDRKDSSSIRSELDTVKRDLSDVKE